MKKLMFALLAALTLVACTTEKKVEKKSLVIYYSITSTTKTAAECIQQMTGADIVALQAKEAYPTDFQEIIDRSMKEMADSVMPEMLPIENDLAAYDTIFVGYPIWFGTYALPMKSWLASADLKGKVVIPFATFGSGGYAQSLADFKACQPEAQVLEGFGIRSALKDMIPNYVEEMLVRLGMKAGEIEQKGEYSEQKAVAKEDTEIFEQAVKGYEMLNATPTTVGSRTVKAGTEYRFEAENKGQDGKKSPITVYVVKENGEKAPYFTLVDYK